MAFIVYRSFGWGFLKQIEVWLMAGIPLLLIAAWYAFSNTLWVEYGNTTGIWGEGFQKVGLPKLGFVMTITERMIRRVTTIPVYCRLLWP